MVDITEEDLNKFKQSLEDLNKRNETQSETIKRYETILGQVAKKQEGLDEKIQGLSQGGGSEGTKDPFDGVDLERLTMTELTQKILDKTSKIIEDTVTKSLTPLQEQIKNTSAFVQTDHYTKQLKDIRAKKKDFDEWVEEIKVLSKDFNNASLDQLYTLAKEGNPEKAAELDKKYNPKDESSNEGQQPIATFGGLATTESSGSSTGERSDKTLREASEAAFSEVFGGQVNVS